MDSSVPTISLENMCLRCHADETVITQDFTERLLPTQSALFDALCPHLRVSVAKIKTVIDNAHPGRLVNEMKENIAVEELHTVLPLMQAGLAEALGVSTWTLATVAKAIVIMERWPSREYVTPAIEATVLDVKLRTEISGGDEYKVAIAAAELADHMEEYSGLHLCAAVLHFEEVTIRIMNSGDGKKERRMAEAMLNDRTHGASQQ